MAFPLIFPIFLGVIIVSGSCLNGITLYILAFDKHLRKQLSSVRAFMLGETLSNLLVCALGVSLILANILFPVLFEQALVLCHIQDFFSFIMSSVALWYQTIIALTRVAAVFAPHLYRRFVKQRFARAVLMCVPWIFSYAGFVVFIAMSAYKLDATDKLCIPVPYDASAESGALYTAYLLENTIHTLLPLFLGLFCYAAIYGRKLCKKFIASGPLNGTNQIGTTAATSATVPVVAMTGSKALSTACVAVNGGSGGGDGDTQMIAITHTTATTPAPKNLVLLKNVAVVRNKKIRLLASVYVVNFLCIAPTFLTFGLGYFESLTVNWPMIAGLLYINAFFAFVVNPLVYYVVSADFRQAFMRLRL